jgi:hypothetical protein
VRSGRSVGCALAPNAHSKRSDRAARNGTVQTFVVKLFTRPLCVIGRSNASSSEYERSSSEPERPSYPNKMQRRTRRRYLLVTNAFDTPQRRSFVGARRMPPQRTAYIAPSVGRTVRAAKPFSKPGRGSPVSGRRPAPGTVTGRAIRAKPRLDAASTVGTPLAMTGGVRRLLPVVQDIHAKALF